MTKKDNYPKLFVYKLLILSSVAYSILIFLFGSKIDISEYDFTSFNLSYFSIQPSLWWLIIHTGIENIKRLYRHYIFVIMGVSVASCLLFYELHFCWANFGSALDGYYSWLICHLLCILGTIIYIYRMGKSLIKL